MSDKLEVENVFAGHGMDQQLQSLMTLNDLALQGAMRVCQDYAEMAATFGEEVTGFLKSRMDEDLRMAQAISECRNLGDFGDARKTWSEKIVNDYVNAGKRLAEMNTHVLNVGLRSMSEAVGDAATSMRR